METEAPIQTEAPVETDGTTSDAPEMEGGVVTGGFIEDTDLLWTLEDGVLTLSGTGALPDYSNIISILPGEDDSSSGDQPWYAYREEITSIQIGEGVTAIGTYAFYNCTKAETVSLPQGLESIGSYAFALCAALTEITIPGTVKTLGTYAFYQCGELTTVTMGEGITQLPSLCFVNCHKLTTLHLPTTIQTLKADFVSPWAESGLTTITVAPKAADDPFYGWEAGDGTILSSAELLSGDTGSDVSALWTLRGGTMPGGSITWLWNRTTGVLTLSGTGTLSLSKTGQESQLPIYPNDQSTSMPSQQPWADFREKITAIQIGEGITQIDDHVFYGCSSAASVSIPATVEHIGQSAFYGCAALETLTLPEGVATLAGDTFSGCTGLKTVYLPLSLKDYGDAESFAFAGCTAITDVYYGGDEFTMEVFLGDNYFDESVTVHYTDLPLPSGSLTDTITWSLDENYVLTITGTGAMPDYEHSQYTPWGVYLMHIKAIHIGEGITHVGDCAFSWCSNVTECTLPSTLKSIGKESFTMGATGTTITLPEGVESVGEDAFFMGSITEVYIPGGCVVGERAFNANRITTITLGEGCTHFSEDYFDRYTVTINLPSTIETMDITLAYFDDLESITVAEDPEGVYEFAGWMDETGYTYTTAELLAGAEYTGVLTALWLKVWNDPFTDVKAGDWFYDSVKYCYQNGLMNGHTETGFYPYATATRGQVVTVLYRLAGEPEATGTMTFTDVSQSAYYYNAVAWANTNGIAKGDNAATFRPTDPVTRQEFLVFLYRFAGYMQIAMNDWSEAIGLEDFADGASVPDWAMEAQCWSVVMGLQTGYELSDGTYLLPYNAINRGEMAAFLARFCQDIYAIAGLELIQSMVGQPTSYALELMGQPSSTSYEASAAVTGAEDGIWYYESGLILYTVKLASGAETVVGWDVQ